MTLFISEAQVSELVGPKGALAAVHAAHLDISEGKVDNVVRSRARAPQMSLHTLAATSTALGYGAAKVYSANRDRVRSHVLLYQIQSGKLCAIIEANNLGKLRTAAASVLSAQLILGDLPNSIALLGTGFQAWGIAESIAANKATGTEPELFVYSRSQEQREKFAEQVHLQLGLKIIPTTTAEEAVSQGIFLITATTSSSPVFERDWIKKTKHIATLGSNALSRQEIPPQTVSGASLLFVDCLETARKEAGNLLKALENGKIFWSQVCELSDIVANPSHYQEQAKDGYSVFSSQGLAAQDLYLAHMVYSRAGHDEQRMLPFFDE